jgi:hypothetical protein
MQTMYVCTYPDAKAVSRKTPHIPDFTGAEGTIHPPAAPGNRCARNGRRQRTPSIGIISPPPYSSAKLSDRRMAQSVGGGV